MSSKTTLLASLIGLCSLASIGCAGTPAAPFNSLPASQVTAFRLQNYEPPATAPAPTGNAVPGLPGIPGLPPEIQSWVTQGAAGLRQLIPPGMLPPGLLPGGAAPAPGAAPGGDQGQRFHGFRILQQTQVMDDATREKIAKALGDKDNFDSSMGGCMYAEMGISFTPSMGAPPDDVLISFSCRQVAVYNFAWPHQGTALKPKAVEQLTEIVQRLWPG